MHGLVIGALLLVPATVSAQELAVDHSEVMRAEVTRVVSQEVGPVPGTDLQVLFQDLEARIVSGSLSGQRITLENDHLELREGDVFYLRHTKDGVSGADYYTVLEPYRIPQLIWLTLAFVLVTVIFGGLQGARGILSLIASIAFIMYVLLPAMLAGYSPVLVSVFAASAIVILGSYITHGFSRMTSTAVAGMVITIGATGLLSYGAIVWTRMTGGVAEASTYLLLNSRGELDLAGLFLGGILIGLLGVLYDAAIGQAVAVEELKRADPDASTKHIFTRALRIGREHIGALVNTLAIAYVGASLPLLLFFYGTESSSILEIVNREIFSSEIVRILVSSIGVIVVVPVTTIIAAHFLAVSGTQSHKGHSHS